MSDSVMTITKLGNKFWKNSAGLYHRLDGPAIMGKDGHKSWYQNGKCHRTNGPAVEFNDGNTSWFVSGKRLGFNDKGFWALWDTLTPEQKQDPVLLSYLPGDFNV